MLWQLALVIACVCTGEIAFADQGMDLPKQAGEECPVSLSGSYEILGNPIPGMPSYFRIRSIKLALDTMLGLDLKIADRKPETIVDVKFSDDILLSARVGDRISAVRLELSQEDTVKCEGKKLVIHRMKEGRGEAVSGVSEVLHQFDLIEDGSLVLITTIKSRSRSLFMSFDNPTEVYGARFKKKTP